MTYQVLVAFEEDVTVPFVPVDSDRRHRHVSGPAMAQLLAQSTAGPDSELNLGVPVRLRFLQLYVEEEGAMGYVA